MKQEFQKVFDLQKSEGPLFIPTLAWRYLHYTTLRYGLRKRFAHRRIHGSTMRLDLHDSGISRALFFIGDREREHRYILEKALTGNETVLDLGANIGYYVLLESKLLSRGGRIIGIEPHPQNFQLLQANVELNHLQNVILLEGAVAENDGISPLYLSKLSNVHSMIKRNTTRHTGRSVDVKTYSLETLKKTYGTIDFIRMDIEGFEQQILHSIIPLLHQTDFSPDLLFETHAKKVNREDFLHTLQQLHDAGYECRYLATASWPDLKKYNLSPIASIPTDGRIRHIVENVPFTVFRDLIWASRCVFLQKNQ